MCEFAERWSEFGRMNSPQINTDSHGFIKGKNVYLRVYLRRKKLGIGNTLAKI
jgi:hypothetical protein